MNAHQRRIERREAKRFIAGIPDLTEAVNRMKKCSTVSAQALGNMVLRMGESNDTLLRLITVPSLVEKPNA